MKRDKTIIVTCHCILNCNSKVEGLSEFKGSIDLAKSFMDKGMGIIQLPCPEMILYGIKRWGHAREKFDNMFYRKEAKKMLMPYIAQFEGYIKSGYDIKGIIAIDGSPSCGFNKTCSSYKWYGELSGCSNLNEKIDDIALVDGRGIFMEVLINLLDEYGLEIPVYGLNESNLKESSLDILSKL